jgi:anti-sigma factor RsiW
MMQSNQHPSDEALAALALEGDHAEIAEHVRACPDCAKRLQHLTAVRDSVASLPEEEVPEGLREHLLAAHSRERRASPGFMLSVKGSRFWFPMLAGLATLTLLLIGMLIYLMQRGM